MRETIMYRKKMQHTLFIAQNVILGCKLMIKKQSILGYEFNYEGNIHIWKEDATYSIAW